MERYFEIKWEIIHLLVWILPIGVMILLARRRGAGAAALFLLALFSTASSIFGFERATTARHSLAFAVAFEAIGIFGLAATALLLARRRPPSRAPPAAAERSRPGRQ